jgi:cytochrome c peroxidase
MLLTKGLIRVGIAMPTNADFDLVKVDDPYGHASAAQLSLFRRPLPATNVSFLATVMWDGRETFANQTIGFDLDDQANGATLGHAQAAAPLDANTQAAIVAFERSLFTAATTDNSAGNLTAQQSNGGPAALAAAAFHIGINDVLGGDPAPNAPPFTANVFTLYSAWNSSTDKTGGTAGARGSVARGQALFNTKPITITGVNGLNDKLGNPAIAGTCTTCHDTPAVGNHSVGLPIDIGVASAAQRTPDLPLYTFRQHGTNATVQVTDPGRALISGSFADIGKFKGPILRALSARPPYFHNGMAATLDDVVAFYDTRFNIGFSPQEHADLVAFLQTL